MTFSVSLGDPCVSGLSDMLTALNRRPLMLTLNIPLQEDPQSLLIPVTISGRLFLFHLFAVPLGITVPGREQPQCCYLSEWAAQGGDKGTHHYLPKGTACKTTRAPS